MTSDSIKHGICKTVVYGRFTRGIGFHISMWVGKWMSLEFRRFGKTFDLMDLSQLFVRFQKEDKITRVGVFKSEIIHSSK